MASGQTAKAIGTTTGRTTHRRGLSAKLGCTMETLSPMSQPPWRPSTKSGYLRGDDARRVKDGCTRAHLSCQLQLLAGAVTFCEPPGPAPGVCPGAPLSLLRPPTFDSICSARSPSPSRASEQVSEPAWVGRHAHCCPSAKRRWGHAGEVRAPRTAVIWALEDVGAADTEDTHVLKERTVSQGGRAETSLC